ncbi:MAG: 30S ribosomal protein S13 [Candidatus Woesearchaeota archaeon]
MEEIVKDQKSIPSWLKNRRKDYETGQDEHITGTDLKFKKDTDIKRMRKIKTYRGMRHSYGLPVRGQRTKGHFRHGATVGVKKAKAAKMGKTG